MRPPPRNIGRALARALIAAAFVLGPTSGIAGAEDGRDRPAPVTAAALTAPAGAAATSDWPTYGGNQFNQRFSGLTQINTTNVAGLKGACVFHTNVDPKLLPASSFEGSPVVVNGIMYLSGPQDQVFAIDAATCHEIWHYKPDLLGISLLPLCCGQINRGVAVGDGKVFIAQLDATLVALDARGGNVLWQVQVASPFEGYSETTPVLFFHPADQPSGTVVVGVSGAEYEIRGRVTAFNADTGELRWRTFTVDQPVAQPPGTDTRGTASFSGGSQWQMPSLDPDLGLVIVAVGNPSPDLDGSQRPGDNRDTQSIVALDMRTGVKRWAFQEIHHDIWDYDATSPPILFDQTNPVTGAVVHGLGQAGKTGWVYLLDRTTGLPLPTAPIVEAPAPNANGAAAAAQLASPTQPTPQGDAFVPQICPQGATVRGDHGELIPVQPSPIFSPFDLTPVLICPGANGGTEWSPASYSQDTRLMYVCGIHQPMAFTRHPQQLTQPVLRLGSVFTQPIDAKAFGTFTAIDTVTDRIRWQRGGTKPGDPVFQQPCIGGSMTTAGNLVFTGEANGNFDAFDSRDGSLLWQFQTGAGVNAPAVSYMVGGTQFVAVAAGGNVQFNYPRGDTLWVFALNGTLGPVAPPAPAPPPAANQVTVDIQDFQFQPFEIHVAPGTTVLWKNGDDTAHTATANRDQTNPIHPYEFSSPLLFKGAVFSHTFATAGEFPYHCNPHPFMSGKVVVDASAPRSGLIIVGGTGEDDQELYQVAASALDLDATPGAPRVARTTIDPNGEATVVFAVRNPSDDLEAMRVAAEQDALSIMRSVYESPMGGAVDTATVLGTFPVEGKRGSARETIVLRATLTSERAAEVNWAQVDATSLASSANVWWLHPGLLGEDIATYVPQVLDQPVRANGDLREDVDVMAAHLDMALDALGTSDMRVARSQLRQFFDRWHEAVADIQLGYRDRYVSMDAEIERAEVALLHRVPEDGDTARLALRAVRADLADIATSLAASPVDDASP